MAPGQAKELLDLIVSKHSGTVDSSDANATVTNNIMHIYSGTGDNLIKCQLLSLLSRSMSKAELFDKLPGLTTYKIDQVRLYATKFNLGFQTPENRTFKGMRMDPEKMEHALAFFFNPAI